CERLRHRERSGRAVHQPVAAPRELEHVARCGAQTKRGAVDEAELATLLRGHRATLALLQCFREEENGGEGRAQVVRELYDEVEPVWAGQAGGQILRLLRRLRLRSGPGAAGSDRLLGRRSEEHTSELQSRVDLVCRLLLEKKK